MHLKRYLLFILLLSFPGLMTGQNIFTYAGGGGLMFGGDGGPATDASLDGPFRIALDALGDLYIADFWNKRVRKVDHVTGVITTIAGNGTPGHDGDGGPATDAGINYPLSLAFDRAGNLYIAADSVRFRTRTNYVYEGAYIRKVTPAGIISTVAGNGTVGYSGDGGPATAAGFDQIWGLASDPAGNIVLTGLRGRLRRIDVGTGIINTIAGNGTFGDTGDGGPATAAGVSGLMDVAIDRVGNIYITGAKLRRIDTAGIITTIAGDTAFVDSGDGGPATAAHLNGPLGVAVDRSGNIYFSEVDFVVRKIDTNGIITRLAGNGTRGGAGDGGPADSAQLEAPEGVAVDSTGNVYIVDFNLQTVRVVCKSCSGVGVPVQQHAKGELQVWPNPGNGYLSIKVTCAVNQAFQLIITDVRGMMMKTTSGRTNEALNIKPDVPPGVYFVKAITPDATYTSTLLMGN